MLKLFRGECLRYTNEKRRQLLGQCIPTCYPSDLACGGNPFLFGYLPFKELVVCHVAEDKSIPPNLLKQRGDVMKHFLSFSERDDRALFFATHAMINGAYQETMECPESATPLDSFPTGWHGRPGLEYLIVELDASNRKRLPETGLYSLCYNDSRNNALLVNVVEYLNGMNGITFSDKNKAIAHSTNDTEWLVLPMDMVIDPYVISRSALLHASYELQLNAYETPDGY